MTRRFQFSLRALLIVLTIGCIWLALSVERAQRQRKAVNAIRSAPGGGSVSYEFKAGELHLGWIKKWLRGALGDEYVLTPKTANIAAFATDKDLEALESLRELRVVVFHGNKSITADGLRHLKGLAKLEYLAARQMNITDDGLAHIEGLVNLKNVDLGLNPITSDGLRHLQPLDDLQGIDLTFTKIDDAGLKCLADKTHLTSMSLWSTNVTDSGLAHLRGLKNLVELNLTATGVTKQGVAELQKDLPKCTIEY